MLFLSFGILTKGFSPGLKDSLNLSLFFPKLALIQSSVNFSFRHIKQLIFIYSKQFTPSFNVIVANFAFIFGIQDQVLVVVVAVKALPLLAFFFLIPSVFSEIGLPNI
uniref:Uncharacterized protein n=1 Tax=Megaselia scalaris TaxID=36166 RepID=T1GUK4_MEGSC